MVMVRAWNGVQRNGIKKLGISSDIPEVGASSIPAGLSAVI